MVNGQWETLESISPHKILNVLIIVSPRTLESYFVKYPKSFVISRAASISTIEPLEISLYRIHSTSDFREAPSAMLR
jgi:hypothetical protein